MRDVVFLEFFGLPETGHVLKAEIRQALVNKLQAVMLKLGKGFDFIARQMRISSETKDFFVLVFSTTCTNASFFLT